MGMRNGRLRTDATAGTIHALRLSAAWDKAVGGEG